MLIRGHSAAQILGNVIADNLMTSADGGGIWLFAAGTPTIRGNLIRGNTATGLSPCAAGGGLSLVNVSDALIVQNVVTGNAAGCGGGVFWLVPSGARGPLLVNNTIADNDSAQGSGIFADGFDAQTELINNIIVASAGQTAVFCGDFNDGNPPLFTFNDVWSPSGAAYGGICPDQTGLNGNLSVDPVFVDPTTGDYHLQPSSPAIDAGDNLAPDLPATDVDGDPRIVDGDGTGAGVIDLGADEFTSDVAIQHAEFFNRRSQLWVSAISTAAPDVALSLTVPGCLQEVRMPRVGDTYVFRDKVPACGNLDGQTATVTSSAGGSDMATIR
jgi:serine protease